MSKKAKLAIIIPIVIVVAIGIVAGAMAGSTTRAYDNTEETAFLSEWMEYLSDDALLCKTVIPGTHDAGTVGMMWAAETQNRTIAEMLACGARYFDLRVENDGGNLVVFHGPIKGMSFLPIIDAISEFLTNHPSETLLLDFQHFKNDGSMEGVDSLLNEKLKGKLVINDTDKADLQFAKELMVGAARGKAMVFWGNYFKNTSECVYINGRNYLFARNNDVGTRTGSSLHSFYKGALNRLASKTYLKKAIPEYVEQFRQSDGGFFVMQMQLTDPIAIIGPKFYEGMHNKNASSFVKSLKDKEYFDVVNIVMRDYIGAEKCKEIIALNEYKGTVKSSKCDEFANKCA